MLGQLLSMFSGTFVWAEEQMTCSWTRNVIISFLSPLTVAAGRTEGTAEDLLALSGHALGCTAQLVYFTFLCRISLQCTAC